MVLCTGGALLLWSGLIVVRSWWRGEQEVEYSDVNVLPFRLLLCRAVNVRLHSLPTPERFK